MAVIHVLDKHTAELIAAGEVVCWIRHLILHRKPVRQDSSYMHLLMG